MAEIEAAQELRLPVPPVVDPSLKSMPAVERQALLDLRAFRPLML